MYKYKYHAARMVIPKKKEQAQVGEVEDSDQVGVRSKTCRQIPSTIGQMVSLTPATLFLSSILIVVREGLAAGMFDANTPLSESPPGRARPFATACQSLVER